MSLEYPDAQYFKVVARFGSLVTDGEDPNEYPDRIPQSAEIILTSDAANKVVRVREADGFWRLDTIDDRKYIVQAGTGELVNPASGSVGVWLVDTSNANVDPQGSTYTAVMRLKSGAQLPVTFNQDSAVPVDTGDGTVMVVDLAAAVSMPASPGADQILGRVNALEAAVALLEGSSPGGGGVTDHGALTGLGDDDHEHYALADGSRGAFAPTSHSHSLADITDYTAPDLSGLVTTTDPRLSDSRPPTGHSHPISGPTGITGLQTALDGKQPAGSYAPANHHHDAAYATTAQGAKADTALQAATPQPINTQTGTTYTLAAADAGKLVTLTNAAAITLTVPAGVFTAGQRVDCLVAGAGMVTCVPGSGATINGTPSLVSRARYSAFTIVFLTATTAIVVGDMANA